MDHVVAKYGVGRSSVYAALSARRLPSRTVLRAMVLAWDPEGEAAMAKWMGRRREVEAALGSLTGAARRPAPAHTAPGVPVPGGPDARERVPTDDSPSPESSEPAAATAPPSSPPAPTAPVSAVASEIRRLYEAAGKPPLRSISSAVLTDPRSTDISPETVRRVVSGAHARQSSVVAVARALAALGDGEVTDAEERASHLHELETAEGDGGSRPQQGGEEAPRYDFRGAVIHGLHLTAGDGQTLDLRDAVLHEPVVRAGDGQTVNVGDSTLNGMAVWGGDRQTFHFGDATLNDAAVRGGDRQAFHFGDATLNDTAVRGGDGQTFHFEDTTFHGAALLGGDEHVFYTVDRVPPTEPDDAVGAEALTTGPPLLALPPARTETTDEDGKRQDPGPRAAQ
ncbi:hypothetical protein [Streptomyces sp. NPDC007346]|uniref:hypothetical protein n=1 Tax=Streptomyces sp. NPDC007346 TaxID=3154682 RepID=UPI003455C9ED